LMEKRADTSLMPTTSLQSQARALGDPTRHAIFRRLAEADAPLGVAELNERFPLNHNAIRQHLAKLVAAGLVVETREQRQGPGRPRLLYAVDPGAEGSWGTTGPYERLSLLLVEVLRSGAPPDEVGRRFADLFRAASPSGDVVADLVAAMARQGFEPEVREARDGAEIVLHHCPFANVAVADRDTICSLHLGIAEGLAEGSDATVAELVAHEPLRAGCRLRLRARPGDTSDATDDRDAEGRLTLRGGGGR